MKKILLALLLIISSATYASDCCEICEKPNGFYLSGFGGVNLQDESRSRVGYDFSVAVGYRWLGQLRSEFEYSYRNNHFKSERLHVADYVIDIGSLNLSIQSYMVNTLWDLPFGNLGGLQPFVGAGIGYGEAYGKYHVHFSDGLLSVIKGKITHRNFAWQLIAGVAYPICENVDLSTEYRFFQVARSSVYNHTIGMGLKYHF